MTDQEKEAVALLRHMIAQLRTDHADRHEYRLCSVCRLRTDTETFLSRLDARKDEENGACDVCGFGREGRCPRHPPRKDETAPVYAEGLRVVQIVSDPNYLWALRSDGTIWRTTGNGWEHFGEPKGKVIP